MMNTFYLPDLADAQFVRHYFFRHPQHGPCSCVLVTQCKANSPNLQYAHVMYVYEQGDFLTGRPCFAVAAEVNRIAPPGSGRSYFLGMFPGEPQHVNLGASDEWADIEKFADKALEIIVEHFALSAPPQDIGAPTVMVQRFRPPRTSMPVDHNTPSKGHDTPPKAQGKKWWQFWK
jgi:hypothetical protein